MRFLDPVKALYSWIWNSMLRVTFAYCNQLCLYWISCTLNRYFDLSTALQLISCFYYKYIRELRRQTLFRYFIGRTNNRLLTFQPLNPSSIYSFIILLVRLFIQRMLQITLHFCPHKWAGRAAAAGEMRNGCKKVTKHETRRRHWSHRCSW